MAKMKAIVLNERPEYREVFLPSLQEGWTRLKMEYAGLCGSDIHRINKPEAGTHKGEILGHEFVGKISAIRGDARHRVGDIVIGCPLLPCMQCNACIEGHDNLCDSFSAIGRNVRGAFAEYVDVPSTNVHDIPQNLDARTAVLSDVMGVCFHAMNCAENTDGTNLIIGDGTVGCVLAATLARAGCKGVHVVGHHDNNLQLLNKVQRDVKTHMSFQEIMTNSFDCVFECVGGTQTQTFSDAINCVKKHGEIIVLGVYPPAFEIPLKIRYLLIKEARLTSSVAYTSDDFVRGLEVLNANPDLGEFITHDFHLRDFIDGLEIANRKDKGATMKVVYTS